MAKLLRRAAIVLALAGLALFAGNQSRWVAPPAASPWLLAHRGVHQSYALEGVGNDTCTAERIAPPVHGFIENTLPSLQAAFDAGAAMAELDLQPTRDGRFAVFHDWTLDCRTEGHGVTRTQTLADLQRLDVGHGYTADGGRSHPLRGRGVGLLPSLDQVLAAFGDRRLLLHVKSRDPEEGRQLAAALAAHPAVRRARWTVYGSEEPLDALRERLPDQRIATRRDLVQCLLRYAALGWSGHVPAACRGGLMLVPVNIAPWLWGWPHRLQRRITDAGGQLVVLGPYGGGDFSSGIDSAALLRELPPGYAGGIWTNRVLDIAPLLRP